jgi:hypothetical protein
MTTKEATWTDEDTARCKRIWEAYQKEHDLSDRIGETAGIDPQSGRIWIGNSISAIIKERREQGFESPLFFERIGFPTYYRRGGQR